MNHENKPRHVGVEIEFAAVTAEAATGIVRSLFGGEVEAVDPHLFRVRGTDLGDFQCELDFQYAHRPVGGGEPPPAPFDEFAAGLREVIGNIGSLLAPCEIVCPPVVMRELPRIEQLCDALRKAGAEGTGENFFYAFGAQLNVEIASRSAEYVTSILKAYLLLSEWLRAEIGVDPTRQLLAFADPFPQAYAELVLSADYWPAMESLIDGYLAYNPTRNRELDLLPLLCWMDESRIRTTLDDPLIKPRPAFHYRLPNAQLQDPDWSIATEWNRWCQVEYLANDRNSLEEACLAWQEHRQVLFPSPWAEQVRPWLM